MKRNTYPLRNTLFAFVLSVTGAIPTWSAEDIDRQLVFYNGNMAEPKRCMLTPVEGNRYSAIYYDTPVEVQES